MAVTIYNALGYNHYVAAVVDNCMTWAEQSQFPMLFRVLALKSERKINGKSEMEIAYEDLHTPQELANDILNELILK